MGFVHEVQDDDQEVLRLLHVTRDMSLGHVSERDRPCEEEQLVFLAKERDTVSTQDPASPGDTGDSGAMHSVSELLCRRYSVFRLR